MTILNSKGTLYSVGILDGDRSFGGSANPKALRFPAGYADSPAAASYNEPTITIRQFSAGRSHILGLSDSGRIWSWHDFGQPAVQIKFVNIDLREDSTGQSKIMDSSLYGTVKQVTAGWSYSSAYIHGIGIVVWDPIRPRLARHDARRARSVPRRPLESDSEPDTMLLLENFELPKTGYQRPKGTTRQKDTEQSLGAEVGQVTNYILLEHFVVFVTDIGKVFCCRLDEKDKEDNIQELCALRGEPGTTLDVQGSFRTFAIFNSGEVIIAQQDYLERSWDTRATDPEQTNVTGLKRIPALQNNNVVSIAFGDYHFLALHSNGKITSYGKQMPSYEALGLGEMPASRLRGLDSGGIVQWGNFGLIPHAYASGRKVWFRREQQEWLELLHNGGKDPKEAEDRLRTYAEGERLVLGDISEWVEQEAEAWDEVRKMLFSKSRTLDDRKHFGFGATVSWANYFGCAIVVGSLLTMNQDKGEDGLGAYFALRVSAAGWHSGAVLLVNEELADKETNYDWRNKSFPRLILSNGEEMPGSVPINPWRKGRPEWKSGLEDL